MKTELSGKEVAARLAGPEVAHAGEPVSLVLLTHVPEREPLSPRPEERRGLGTGAVIGNNQIEVGVGLVGQRTEHGIECLRPLVRRDDDGNGHARNGEASFVTSGPRRYFSSFHESPGGAPPLRMIRRARPTRSRR